MPHRWVTTGTIAIVLVLALASVRFIAAPAFIAAPDSVHIVVTEVQLPTANKTVIFDHQFAQQANAIYKQLLAGGPLTAPAACPGISGQQPYYRYALTFFHLNMQVVTAISDAVGCQNFTATYPGGSTAVYSWIGNDHSSFWVRLHQLVNAPEPIGICMTMPSCH